MAEGAALFDPGFLGTQFIWWLGQVADDSEWRDNILPGKFEDANSIPGWGRRYKVRIMGIHDKEVYPIGSVALGECHVSHHCWWWTNGGKSDPHDPSG